MKSHLNQILQQFLKVCTYIGALWKSKNGKIKFILQFRNAKSKEKRQKIPL